MSNHANARVQSRTKLASLSLIAALITASVPASAAVSPNAPTVPIQVDVFPGLVIVNAVSDPDGTVTLFKAQLASPCSLVPANTIDTLKGYQSLAQGALLSGKTITIYWTSCNMVRYITGIVLNR